MRHSRLVSRFCTGCKIDTPHKPGGGGSQCIHCQTVIATVKSFGEKQQEKRKVIRKKRGYAGMMDERNFEHMRLAKAERKYREQHGSLPTDKPDITGPAWQAVKTGRERTKI